MKIEWKNKKNDWRIVYSLLYYDLQSKIGKKNDSKNDWRIVYNSIYYDFEWKIGKKNDSKKTQE